MTAHGPYAAAEAAATASTLNYALGNLGGRQKAWMTSSQPTSPNQNLNPPTIKRKPGRPPRPRPGELVQTAHPASSVTELHREKQPASNSTSPQLANVVSHQPAGHPLPSPTAVFPSPSPSEEAIVDTAPTPTNPSTGAVAQETGSAQYVTPSHTSSDLRFMEGPRQAAPAPKRPAEADLAAADKRSRVGDCAQEARPIPPPLRTQSPLHRHTDPRRASLGGQSAGASPSVTPVQGFSPSLGRQQPQFHSPNLRHSIPQGMQNQPQGQLQPGRTPPQPQGPFGPPRSLSRGLAQQPFAVPPGGNVASPTPQAAASVQRTPTAASDWYTQQDCARELNLFFATHTISANHPRDGKRLDVLRDAVERRDWAYLTMHQNYCLLTADPTSLPASFRNHPNLPSAVRLMRNVLDANDSLSPPVLRFFANFPLPLMQLATTFPQQCAHEALMFQNFMLHSANFDSLKTSCEQRNCPMLMRELVYDLGITSTVFQRIVFTATLRRLWSLWRIPNTQMQAQYESQALNIFFSNQTDYHRREASRPNNQPQSFDSERRERDMEMQQWGTQLKRLCDTYQRTLQQSVPGSFLPSQPTLATAPQSHQQTRQPSLQNYQPSQVPAPRASVQTMPAHSAQAAIQRGRGRGQPRIYPPQPRPQPSPANQQVPRLHTTPSHTAPLLPHPGVNQPQQRQPNPARFGLHHAYLRSPVLRAQPAQSMLYQYIKGFFKPPVRLTDAGHKIEKWTFALTPEDLQSIPKDLASSAGAPTIRDVNENSQMLRVRCVKWTSTQLPDEHTWATADTSWIPYSYFTFNGVDLHQRKKLHHGKDLPMDISAFVQEGDNSLEITVMRQRSDENYRKYLVAIETLGVKSHAAIMEDCTSTNHVSASTTMQHIMQKLNSATDDDEISIVESNLTISLFDPFSASKICEIPARSKACLHYDCFDLRTFLQTRKRRGDATVTDQWKCPICNGDARPQHLIVDGFLEEVRDKLEQQGLAETRAIIIEQDGSWRPKVEVRDPNGVQDRGSPDDDPVPTNVQRQTPVHSKVIDLSD